MKDNTESLNAGEKITGFIQRNRKAIFIVSGLILFTFAGILVFLAVSDHLHKNAVAQADEFERRFRELQRDSAVNETEINNLLEEVNGFAKGKSGFAGARAWSIIAEIYSDREDWQRAQEAWLSAADAGPGTYLAPMALFNAAACAEEQGNFDRAIELLKEAISHRVLFPASPRAQFSIGRLHEQMGNLTEATMAYRELIVRWPDIPVWSNLAQSRIIALEIQ